MVAYEVPIYCLVLLGKDGLRLIVRAGLTNPDAYALRDSLPAQAGWISFVGIL